MASNGAAAVGFLQTVRAVALDDALIAVAFADSRHVDEIARREGIGLDNVAHIEIGGVVELFELPQILLGADVGFVQVSHFGLGQFALRHVLKAELDRLIAVFLGGFLLYDGTGTRLDDCDRNDPAVFVKNLGHTHFFADDCPHCVSSLIQVIGRRRRLDLSIRRNAAGQTKGFAIGIDQIWIDLRVDQALIPGWIKVSR